LEVVCIEFGITYKDLRGRCRRWLWAHNPQMCRPFVR
jgi:hypothetical protein